MRIPKYKIVFCTPAIYSAGGVERIVSSKANYFAEQFGYDVTIVVTEGQGATSFFTLSDKVKIINLCLNFEELWGMPFWNKVVLYIGKQRQYKKRLKTILHDVQPDITISTLRREANFINSIDDGSIKIGELHLPRSNYRKNDAKKSNIIKRLFYKWWVSDVVNVFSRFDKLVVLTNNAALEWPELKNIYLIPDPMSLAISKFSSLDNKRVIAVGRYSFEKGYDMLLKIWSIVEKQCIDWRLDIYAMGDPTPYVKMMTELCIDRNRCRLNAGMSDVLDEYLQSSILVQPSRSEGFGLVMVEAMACGLPVVAFDCENGPRSIMRDGEDGFLIPMFDINLFASRLVALMHNESLRYEMGKNGRIKSKQYGIEKVALQWKQLFDELMKKR